jgi:chorismate mutase
VSRAGWTPQPHQEETVSVTTDPTPQAAVPSTEEIAELRQEIDRLDAEILRLVLRRSEVSRRIGAARMAAGGPRFVHNREMAVLARFRELGAEGRELGMLLLRLGRGRLGGH